MAAFEVAFLYEEATDMQVTVNRTQLRQSWPYQGLFCVKKKKKIRMISFGHKRDLLSRNRVERNLISDVNSVPRKVALYKLKMQFKEHNAF